MNRICEDLGVVSSLNPKPMPGDWNGAGAVADPGGVRTNPPFSTPHFKHLLIQRLSSALSSLSN